MTRTTIIILALSIAFVAHAQFMITNQDHALIPGESVNFTEIPYVSPGEPGPNRIWDFSKIDMTGEPIVTSLKEPVTGTLKEAVEYDLLLTERDKEYYIRQDKNAIMRVGAVADGYNILFSDPVISMIYPFAYGDNYTDGYAWSAVSATGYKIEFVGELEVTADAFGTLILPDRTFTGVLRVKTETNGLQMHICNTVEIHATRYLWYAPGIRYPVMNSLVTERTISGREAKVTKRTVVNNTPPAKPDAPEGKDETALTSDVTVVIYPNPFEETLNYHYFLRESLPVTITLSDITGKTAVTISKRHLQPEGLHSGSIDAAIHSLNPGVYYLRFIFDKKVIVRKVIKL